jgi:capsular polysaccharide biosynthesis protein
MVVVLVYALTQPSLYQTEGTIIIRPRDTLELDRNVVRALDTLSRGDEIGSTFAEIFTSNDVHNSAVRTLELPPELQICLDVTSNTVGGTNILEIRINGNDPDTVLSFAEQVTNEAMQRVEDIYNVFELEILDNFQRPSYAVRPNTEIIAIGLFLAILLSIGVVTLVELVINSEGLYDYFGHETFIKTRDYFHYRLKQEISHANHSKYKFSLAMVRGYDQSGKVQAKFELESIANIIREEDIAVNYQPDMAGLIFPGSSAYSIYRMFCTNYESEAPDESKPYPIISVGISEYPKSNMDGSIFINQTIDALLNGER